jgi:hypothetical protein
MLGQCPSCELVTGALPGEDAGSPCHAPPLWYLGPLIRLSKKEKLTKVTRIGK